MRLSFRFREEWLVINLASPACGTMSSAISRLGERITFLQSPRPGINTPPLITNIPSTIPLDIRRVPQPYIDFTDHKVLVVGLTIQKIIDDNMRRLRTFEDMPTLRFPKSLWTGSPGFWKQPYI